MRRTVFVLLALLVGSACAVAQSALPKKGAGLKTVGVISAIGHTFALQKVGVTVFGNELKEMPIESWGIDDAVVAKVSALSGKRFNVRRINYPRGAFASYEAPGGLFRDRDAELREIVRKIAAPQKSDLYVVVTRGGSPFGTTNQFASGLGLVVATSPFVDNSHLHALSVIHVYDGQSFALLQQKAASIGQPTFLKTIKGPHREVDKSWWPASLQAAQNAKLRDVARALVEQSVAMTLPGMLKVD